MAGACHATFNHTSPRYLALFVLVACLLLRHPADVLSLRRKTPMGTHQRMMEKRATAVEQSLIRRT